LLALRRFGLSSLDGLVVCILQVGEVSSFLLFREVLLPAVVANRDCAAREAARKHHYNSHHESDERVVIKFLCLLRAGRSRDHELLGTVSVFDRGCVLELLVGQVVNETAARHAFGLLKPKGGLVGAAVVTCAAV
jgi:hypothetical protein